MKVVVSFLILAIFWGASGRSLARSSEASSESQEGRAHSESKKHGERSSQRQIDDTFMTEVSEEDSEKIQNSLEQVLNTLLRINSGRVPASATN